MIESITTTKIARRNYQELIKGCLIRVKTNNLILTTNEFNPGTDTPNKLILTNMKIRYPYILGDMLFRLKYGEDAKLISRYPSFRIIEDPRGGNLIVRELYHLPKRTWIFRTHKGSIWAPEETVYLEIDPGSVKTLNRTKAFEATNDFSIPITDQLYDEIIEASLIDFETGNLILTSDDIDCRNETSVVESMLKYMQEKQAYILGDVLFCMDRGRNAELEYEYSHFKLMADPGKKSYLIVKELYRLPDETWVLRAHKGSIDNPKRTEYWEIDARSAKASLEREIRELVYTKKSIWGIQIHMLKGIIDLYFSA